MPFKPLTPEQQNQFGLNQGNVPTTPTRKPFSFEDILPTAGTMLGKPVSMAGGIPLGAGISGVGAASGYQLQQLIKALKGESVFQRPEYSFPQNLDEYVNQISKNFATGTAAGAGGELASKFVLGPLAEKIFGKAGKVGLGLPSKIQKSAEEKMNTIYGPEIGKIISQIENKSVDVTGIINKLNDVRSEAVLAGDDAAVRAVDSVIKRVRPKTSITSLIPENLGKPVKEAFATKKAFGKDILKPSGEVRISTGNKGAVTKLAKAISGDEMQKLLVNEAVKSGMTKAPAMFEKYAALSKLAHAMESKPFGGYQMGYILPLIIGGLIGKSPTLTAAGAATAAATMPYTRTLLQQVTGRGVESLAPVTKAILKSILSRKFSGARE